MRVYQFRHIRAERQCSQADYGPWAALATQPSAAVTPSSNVSPTMTAVRRGLPICLLALVALATGSARAEQPAPAGELVEVVVSLSQKPLATTTWRAGRQVQTRALAKAQASLARRIEAAVPDAQIRWRYRLVANGMAVVVPSAQLGRLTSLPGIETVYPSASYRPQLDRSPQQIGAPAAVGPRARRTPARGSRSRSSTRGSTRRTRSSRPRATRCPPATRRGRRPTRPPR